MKKYKYNHRIHIINLIFIIVFTIFMAISGIYAYTNIKVNSIDSELNLGAVNIALEQYSIDNENVRKKLTSNIITDRYLPGNEENFSLEVVNKADPCYIRVKFKEGLYSLNEVSLKIHPNADFIKNDDGYYYCKKPLNFNESKYIDYKIQTLHTLNNESTNKKNSMIIIAEAVQNKNFSPDFNSSDPWKNIEIEQCKQINYTVSEDLITPKINVTYQNDGNKYVNAPKNFLEDLKTIMPGDKFTYMVDIKNPDKEKTNFYFYMQINNELEDNQKEILNRTNLLITDKNNSIVYNGPLFNEKEIPLGEYAQGDNNLLTFKISITENLKNKFSILSTNFTWKFTRTTQETSDLKDLSNKNTVKTGSKSANVSFLIFILSAICLTLTSFFDWRHQKFYLKSNTN